MQAMQHEVFGESHLNTHKVVLHLLLLAFTPLMRCENGICKI